MIRSKANRLLPARSLTALILGRPDHPVTFSVDLEDHGGGLDRLAGNASRLLDWLASNHVRATIFTVGELGRTAPAIIRRFAEAGHEIACHGEVHERLEQLSPAQLRTGLIAARQRLSDLSGQSVEGFRAPEFSLTPLTPWVPNVLAEAGYLWSSSVMPTRLRGGKAPIGWAGLPARPFLWPSGVLEIPVPLLRIGPFHVPFMGGMWLRYLPLPLLRLAIKRMGDQPSWAYCHPYDIDTKEKFSLLPGRSCVASMAMWANRGRMVERMTILAANPAPCFGERVLLWRQQAVTIQKQ
ncbi:Chitooligosaccharide deacetylase [Granulibacter bethesdensis CGDNIH4]|nr:Chitooligosaccharide deacetylase [Granulibacter bethesdensis CGDNIH4]